MQDIEKTKVIFRRWHKKLDQIDSGDQIIAIFPEIPGTSDPYTCMSYEHIGQHGSASIEIIERTRPASPYEYADLKSELENLSPSGYNLEIIKRHRSAHTNARRAELARMR